MTTCYIGLGSNKGRPLAYLQAAVRALRQLPATRLCACSPIYRTAAIGCLPNTPDFYNAVVRLQTALPPPRLFCALRKIEAAIQKQARAQNMPRRLDVDLLCYGAVRHVSKTLTLPHPRMLARAFVLQPLLDIALPHTTIFSQAQHALSTLPPQAIQKLAP